MARRAGGDRERRDVRRTFVVTVVFMAVKSLLASRQAKGFVERRVGTRLRNGLYRPVYVLFSTAGGLLVLRQAYRQPHRVLYEARPPLRWLMRMGQLVSVVLTLETTRFLGLPFLGISQIRALVHGGQPELEPEAQGPPPERSGELSHRSFFAITRHPNNWFPTVFFILEPRMTNKRAVYTALMMLHVLLGSVHEEYRLQQQYGAAYARYKKVAPFFFSSSRSRQGGFR